MQEYQKDAGEAGAQSGDVAGDGSAVAPERPSGRHRVHRFPARSKALKVLYDEAEFGSIEQAARRAGLRPSGYVATAALAAAQGRTATDDTGARELLEELLRLRLEVRRYGVNVNQIAAAMNAGGDEAPVWLRHVAERGERTLGSIDQVTALLSRRLP